MKRAMLHYIKKQPPTVPFPGQTTTKTRVYCLVNKKWKDNVVKVNSISR